MIKEIKVNEENYDLLINWWENSSFIYTRYNDLIIKKSPTSINPYGIIQVSNFMYNFLTNVCNINK